MREENPLESRTKALKFSDQNQAPKLRNSSKLRSASSWGSQIVKNFAGEKKTKLQATNAGPKKQPLVGSDAANQKNPLGPAPAAAHSRVKRSLIGDLACSVNASQVHPQAFQTHRRQSSRDLFTELDHLRVLLQESKDREFKLQAELAEWKRNPRVLELERELEVKKSEVEGLSRRFELLEEEKVSLSEQVSALEMERSEELDKREEHESLKEQGLSQSMEMEVVELRRLNKELQLQKRSLACRLSSVESQLSSLVKASEVLLSATFIFGFCLFWFQYFLL